MTEFRENKAGQVHVVRCLRYPQSAHRSRAVMWMRALCTILVTCVMILSAMLGAQTGYADETNSNNESKNVSSNITDPQNLLGENATKVSDEIEATKQKTGVDVRLLYLASFNSTEKPEKWAGKLLDSLNPAPNTVLLAVASNDGSLAVAVSPNSDEWLRKQQTVEDLSDAALKPIVEHKDQEEPNWAQSAIDMMQEIETIKQTSTSSSTSSIGIIVLIVVLVLLVALAIIAFILHQRKHSKKKDEAEDNRTESHKQSQNSLNEEDEENKPLLSNRGRHRAKK